MSNWIKVDQTPMVQQFAAGDVDKPGGQIKVFVSPYDVPEAVRGQLDEDTHNFRIEFRYLSNDPGTKKEYDDGTASLYLGINSGRICKIAINVKKLGKLSVGSIVPLVERAVQTATAKLAGKAREKNYSLATQAIAQQLEAVFSELL